MPAPHASARKFVQDYGKRNGRSIHGVKRPLDLVFNRQWADSYTDEEGRKVTHLDPSLRYLIIQKTTILEHMKGLPISYTMKTDIPVLMFQHAAHPDSRWIPALEESRIRQWKKKMLTYEQKRFMKLRKKYMDDAEAWAKDNYSEFLKWSDDRMLHQYKAKDPREALKKFQDKHGRFPKRGLTRTVKAN